MPRFLQIFFASVFGISTWRGTASTEPFAGFVQREWAAPSRLSTQPWRRRCLSSALRFTERSPYPVRRLEEAPGGHLRAGLLG